MTDTIDVDLNQSDPDNVGFDRPRIYCKQTDASPRAQTKSNIGRRFALIASDNRVQGDGERPRSQVFLRFLVVIVQFLPIEIQ